MAHSIAAAHATVCKATDAIARVADRALSTQDQASHQQIGLKKAPVSSLFKRAIESIQQHPFRTLAAFSITAALGCSLILTGTVVACVAAAALLGVALTLATLQVIAFCRNVQEQHTCSLIDSLEIAEMLTAHEAEELKKSIRQPAAYQKLLEKQFRRWKADQKLSSEECFQLTRLLDQKGIHQAFNRIEKMALAPSGNPVCKIKSVKGEILACVNKLEHSSRTNDLSTALKRNDQGAFRKALIAHYRETGLQKKKNENLVSFYCYQELGKKIKAASEEETFATFVRLQRHLTLFDNHDLILSHLAKRLNAIHQLGSSHTDANELNQIQDKLHRLHQDSQKLLADYAFISPEVDDLFACYRGSFAQKFRIMQERLDQLSPGNAIGMDAELPLAPKKRADDKPAASRGPSPRMVLEKKLEEIRQKLEKKELLNPQEIERLNVQANSLKRTLADLQAIELMKGENKQVSSHAPHKKSIMIATCSFGTGHKQAAHALKGHIGNAARVSILDPTEYDSEFVKKNDWLCKLGKKFGKKWSFANVFNHILKDQQYWMINIYSRLSRINRVLGRAFKPAQISNSQPCRAGQKKLKHFLRQRFLMERPDLLVTTYHMDLKPFIQTAEEMGLPLLHVPTDLDVKMEEIFGNSSPSYTHFKTFLPDNNRATLETVKHLGADKIHSETVDGEEQQVAGIALRPEFYVKRSKEEIAAIKKERGIDPEAKVLLVLSGGNGQELPYPEMLLNAPNNGKKYHMIVVAGSNNEAGNNLNQKKEAGKRFITGKNPNITVEVAEDPAIATAQQPYFIGASELSRLHAIADVAITKPGGLSIGELLQTGVPMIMDRRVTPMVWEDFNIKVVKEQKRGLAYTGKHSIMDLIDEVVELGKKPRPNYSKWFTAQMMEMIAKAEDVTNPVMVQHRKYKEPFKE
ncbi:MAG: hypothetical protein LLG04_18295 [Parachlamydia sp.]|nr:hypothetical protein [Parachlamydia sp.]